ncbi:uncharacterized protein JN550_013555 [Neoarthrinium moseri]|uniref:uncharacterized protein n=1 Tax=Neoarthrinium moseri TaxID=1658444 RepID=UPI001FDC52B9|nr:uncharacterized protein JN550_013555 [Neoarthrinium moseri]KAI1856953.1 hypothetical protein JN550_013555 [Neoarthrinium moseri]
MRLPDSTSVKDKFTLQSVTLGKRDEQNPYTAELAAMAEGLRGVPHSFRQRVVVVFTSNNGAALSMKRPRQQSGQQEIADFYAAQEDTEDRENNEENEDTNDNTGHGAIHGTAALQQLAKEAARKATLAGCPPRVKPFRAKSTTLNNARKKLGGTEALPGTIGAFSKRIDRALPGGHTRLLYDARSWREASILVQLRAGMARLNYYLAQIGAVTSPDSD